MSVLCRALRLVLRVKMPFVCFTASGGARMQERFVFTDANGEDQCGFGAFGCVVCPMFVY